jgi:hypothetical protein
MLGIYVFRYYISYLFVGLITIVPIIISYLIDKIMKSYLLGGIDAGVFIQIYIYIIKFSYINK